MRTLNVIGLNSGTSMDGIDAALFSITPKTQIAAASTTVPDLKIEMIGSLLYPFEIEFQRRLLATVQAPSVSWQEACLLNAALGEIFGDAALELIRQCGDKAKAVDLIGSHGQTIWHAPTQTEFWGRQTAGTLQLGEPAVIAARTGVPVIADFRTADIASGGEGAPLVCFADEVLFGHSGEAKGILNIGGIANITALDASGRAVMAFDTGPGNMLMDRAAHKLFGKDFDQSGEIAASGKVDEEWLRELLENAYYERVPPKTTGRELFGYAYADGLLVGAAERRIPNADILATLTKLTAVSIARSYERFIHPKLTIKSIVVGGGGAENDYLMKLLSEAWPGGVKIGPHEEFGVSTKFKEALLFALLAYTTFFQIPNNVPACTGARQRVCLGKLVTAPPAALVV